MSKVAIVTDTHFGVRNDDVLFAKYFEKFYSETFFPTLRERKINTIIHTGDVVDRRKYINYRSSNMMKSMFFDPIRDHNMELFITVGNHDVYYKNTNKINSMTEFFSNEKHIKIFTNPEEFTVEGKKILFVPWICDENRDKFNELLRTSDAKILLGHLEIIGFEMYPGFVNNDGMNADLFQSFDFVGSGHLHHRSSNENIHYFGSPYETTWSDFGDKRGFHILDLDTLELEFIENPNTMFSKIFYSDDDEMDDIDFGSYESKIVKVIVINKQDTKKFEKFIEKLIKAGPYDLKVVDDHLNMMKQTSADIVSAAGDTFTIVNDYVGGLTIPDNDKKELVKIFHSLYNESLQEM